MGPGEMGISVAPLGLTEQAPSFPTGSRPWLRTYAPNRGYVVNHAFDLMHTEHIRGAWKKVRIPHG